MTAVSPKLVGEEEGAVMERDLTPLVNGAKTIQFKCPQSLWERKRAQSRKEI